MPVSPSSVFAQIFGQGRGNPPTLISAENEKKAIPVQTFEGIRQLETAGRENGGGKKKSFAGSPPRQGWRPMQKKRERRGRGRSLEEGKKKNEYCWGASQRDFRAEQEKRGGGGRNRVLSEREGSRARSNTKGGWRNEAGVRKGDKSAPSTREENPNNSFGTGRGKEEKRVSALSQPICS